MLIVHKNTEITVEYMHDITYNLFYDNHERFTVVLINLSIKSRKSIERNI